MAINKGQKIIRLQVIAKFNSILNNINVIYEKASIQKKIKYYPNPFLPYWFWITQTTYTQHITNVPTNYTSKNVYTIIDNKIVNLTISTKKDVAQTINILLQQISYNAIDAKNLLSNIQYAMKQLSRLRYTVCRSFTGTDANGAPHGWSAATFLSDGIGAFTDVRQSQTFTKNATNNIKSNIVANKPVVAEDVIKYFNLLLSNYVQWKNKNTHQYIDIYYCHTNCHTSCYARSRR